MSSCIEGKGINFIRRNGGLVAGQPETIDIHTCCDVITVTKPEDVKLVNDILKEGNRLRNHLEEENNPDSPPFDLMDYLEWSLVEQAGW